MQLREKPPVVIDPDVEHLMKGEMLEVRDLMLDRAIALAETHDIAIARIMIRSRVWTEDDCEDDDCEDCEDKDVVFEIDVDTRDDDRAFRYWEAVSDAMTPEAAPERLRGLMDNTWVLLYW